MRPLSAKRSLTTTRKRGGDAFPTSCARDATAMLMQPYVFPEVDIWWYLPWLELQGNTSYSVIFTITMNMDYTYLKCFVFRPVRKAPCVSSYSR